MPDSPPDPAGLGFEIEMKSPRALSPHPENYRHHPPEQIAEIKKSLREHGFYKNVVVARDYTILAGHGVVEAAADMDEIEQIPVYVLDVDPMSDAARKVIVADNETPKQSIDDEEKLVALLREIHTPDAEGGGLEGTGFDEDMMNEVMSSLDGEDGQENETYTDRVDTPTYEVTGEEPAVTDLYDTDKTEALVEEIREADLSEDLRTFLVAAAYRHTRFDFENIAEFYAHAPPEVQRLFEKSALVIIDYEQAVEQGFVNLSENMKEIAEADEEAA